MIEEKLARLAPNTLGTLAFLLIFGGLARIVLTWKETGIFPLVAFTRGDGSERLRAAAAFAWPMLLLAAAAAPGRFPPPWALLNNAPAKFAGVFLISLGFAAAASAYLALGPSFRVGADPDQKSRLVTEGIYAHVRHPVYLGMILIQAGAFLVFPTGPFLLAAVAMAWGADRQAAREERVLLASFGEAYRAYMGRSGRLLPFHRAKSTG